MKIQLYEKRYNLETKRIRIVLTFQACNIRKYLEITGQRALRQGRAGLGRFIMDINYMVINEKKLFYKLYRKIIRFRDIALIESSKVPLRSASLTIIFFVNFLFRF